MKKIILYLALMVYMTVFYSCQKKSSVPNYPLNSALVAAFDFKVGSYWIYKDSISGMEDSFYVTSNSGIQTTTASGNQWTQQTLDFAVSEVNIAPLPAQNYIQEWNYYFMNDVFWVYYAESKIYSGNITYAPLIFYPYDSIPAVFPIPGGVNYPASITIMKVLSSLIVNGQSFSDVEQTNDLASLTATENYPLGQAYSYNDWLYIAPNVGLIKIVQNHPQDSLYRIWEILRWHIE